MNMTLEQEFQARLEDSMHDILTVYYNVKYKREYAMEHEHDPALMLNIVTGVADREVNDRVTNKLVSLKCNKEEYIEAYNNAYLGNQLKDSEKKNKTTVAENTAVAEQSTVNESAINTIYNAAYGK